MNDLQCLRGETAAASGAKPPARAQPMSALPYYILVSVLLYNSKVLLTVLIGCIAAHENTVSPATTFIADVR